MEVIADARRGNINQLVNVFPSLTNPLVCFRRAAFKKAPFPVFPRKTGTFAGLFLCPLSDNLCPPHTGKHTHIYLSTSYLNSRVCVCVCVFESGDWCGMLPQSFSGKIPDVRKWISPLWLGHVVGQEILHQAPSNSLGDCSSQRNGNKAQGAGSGGDLPSTSTPAPEGSSQACAIHFLTIYSQVEFIFPEEPHMWCISGFRLWGWGRRSRLWSQSIKVATNSVFLEGRVF